MPYQALADAVLLLHFMVVLFVVFGLPLTLLGNRFGWAWVNAFRWRVLHLLAIVLIALQAWLGQYCPLTLLENALRERAGQAPYAESFIEHWVARLIYFEAPLWVFAILYTLFALVVAWAWWRYPPSRRRSC